MKLINPTDDELNAAFAEKVAGWKLTIEGESHPWWFVSGKPHLPLYETPRFTTSADAVLPWLNAPGWLWSASNDEIYTKKPFTVCVHRGQQEASASDTTFPRAATIALLRAHGAEIEFTK